MSRRERVAGRAQAYRHVVALAGNEWRGMLVALAMREVEHAGRYEGRLAGRRDVAETDGDEGRRTVSRNRQAGFRKAENLDPLLERRRVEAEREPVVEPLVRRQIRGIAVRAPEARVEPAELRAAHVEPATRAGRLRERALAESKDPTRHSGADATPPRPPSVRGAPRGALDQEPVPAARHEAAAPCRCPCRRPSASGPTTADTPGGIRSPARAHRRAGTREPTGPMSPLRGPGSPASSRKIAFVYPSAQPPTA